MFTKALAGLKKIGKSLQGPEALAPQSDLAVPATPSNAMPSATTNALWAALGGQANVRAFKAVACTRLRVELLDATQFNPQQAQQAGVLAVAHVANQVIHLIVGPHAALLEADLRAI